jgi:hypothetical protein
MGQPFECEEALEEWGQVCGRCNVREFADLAFVTAHCMSAYVWFCFDWLA